MKNILSIALVIILLATSLVFADDSQALSPFEIVSPQTDDSNSVVYSSNLDITIKINSEVDAVMTIVRIDNVPAFDELSRLQVIALNAPTMRNRLYDKNAPEQDPLPTDVNLSNIYNSYMSFNEVQEAYAQQARRLKGSYDQYNAEFWRLTSYYNKDFLTKLVNNRLLLAYGLSSLHNKRVAYEKNAILFLKIQSKYESQFRTTVAHRVAVEKNGALPFFNYTLKDVHTGIYEIIIINPNTGSYLIPKKRFYVKSKEEFAQELISAFKREMINIWNAE